MFKKIIVGLDGSEKALNAARVACDLARHYGSEVTLVHVPHAESAAVTLGLEDAYYAATKIPSMAEAETAGHTILKQGRAVAEKAGCKEVKTHMPFGDAASEIIAHAEAIDADLIVTGRRGLSRFSSLILGSTTQRINKLAKCACLSLP